jgi:hypothetical protein
MLHVEEELHPAQRRGRFEAVATHVLDDAAQENLVGCFDTEAEAAKALGVYLRVVELAEDDDAAPRR